MSHIVHGPAGGDHSRHHTFLFIAHGLYPHLLIIVLREGKYPGLAILLGDLRSWRYYIQRSNTENFGGCQHVLLS